MYQRPYFLSNSVSPAHFNWVLMSSDYNTSIYKKVGRQVCGREGAKTVAEYMYVYMGERAACLACLHQSQTVATLAGNTAGGTDGTEVLLMQSERHGHDNLYYDIL